MYVGIVCMCDSGKCVQDNFFTRTFGSSRSAQCKMTN